MLTTPFGNIEIYFDEKIQENVTITKSKKNNDLYPDIECAYLISYEYFSDQKNHSLKCRLVGNAEEGFIESGERLEAISFHIKGGKITIGCEGEFGIPREPGYDYDGDYLDNGLEIIIEPSTKSRTFIFGVSWLTECTEKNDTQTWFASDPFTHSY